MLFIRLLRSSLQVCIPGPLWQSILNHTDNCVCVDHRTLNHCSAKDNYSIPHPLMYSRPLCMGTALLQVINLFHLSVVLFCGIAALWCDQLCSILNTDRLRFQSWWPHKVRHAWEDVDLSVAVREGQSLLLGLKSGFKSVDVTLS